MVLSEREHHILEFFYRNMSDCCIDDGNVLAWYSDKYQDWTDTENCETALAGLEAKGLVSRDDPPLDCFIAITDFGISHAC